VTTVQCEPTYMTPHNEPRHIEMKESELVKSPCMLPLCHPFTAVLAGPTGCGKTAWVLRLIDNVREKIQPVPTRIWYYYGEHQPVFNNYPQVHFEDGLPQLNDEVFDGREPTMIVVRRSHVRCQSTGCRHFNENFSSSQHQHTISHTHSFDKKEYEGIISLKAHYLVLFKNRRDAGEFAIFARQMYPTCWKFAAEDEDEDEHGVRLSTIGSKNRSRRALSSQKECFPGEMQHVYVRK